MSAKWFVIATLVFLCSVACTDNVKEWMERAQQLEKEQQQRRAIGALDAAEFHLRQQLEEMRVRRQWNLFHQLYRTAAEIEMNTFRSASALIVG